LHGIFRVLALATDLHAEREHGILEQGQGPFQGFVIPALQQDHSLLYFGAHFGKCSMPTEFSTFTRLFSDET
jgi:hypothetical protein